MAFKKQISDPNNTQIETGESLETDHFDHLDRHIKGLDVITDTRERLARVEERLNHVATKEQLVYSKLWSVLTIAGAIYCTLIGASHLFKILNPD